MFVRQDVRFSSKPKVAMKLALNPHPLQKAQRMRHPQSSHSSTPAQLASHPISHSTARLASATIPINDANATRIAVSQNESVRLPTLVDPGFTHHSGLVAKNIGYSKVNATTFAVTSAMQISKDGSRHSLPTRPTTTPSASAGIRRSGTGKNPFPPTALRDV